VPDAAHWAVFFAATFVLLAIPGPSVIYVITQGVVEGPRGAVLASLGLAAGDFAQVLATVAGLSVLIASSAVTLRALQYAGAAYLVFLGLRAFIGTAPRAAPASEADRQPTSARALVTRAFFALNIKTSLFFFALFPQVVDLHAGSPFVQMMCFGAAFTVVGFLTNTAYGCLARRLVLAAAGDRFQSLSRRASGVALVGLGLITAFTV
jgi:threonine/homoserine/homoserine lactone efflux protein